MEEPIFTNEKLPKLLAQNKNAPKRLLLMALILLVFLSGLYVVFSSPKDFPVGAIVNIPEGSTLKDVSRILTEKNIVHSQVVFETFVILGGGEKRIIPGDYLFETKNSVLAVAERMVKGDKQLALVKVTIPEGFNNLEIADSFESKLSYFNKARFLKLAEGKQGYLWPDTYFFLTTDTDEIVFEKMSSTFEQKIKTLEKDILASGKKKSDIIIMASIIEGEANGDDDRGMISGILWKRISIGMALQADVAPITYKERGLPKAPISNPGIEAIKASIFPKTSPYLYYLHDKEGNIYYAKNFDDHRQNIQKYLR